MRNSLIGMLFVLAMSGCGGSANGPVQPPQLSADQEKAIMDRVNQSQQQEGAVPAQPQP